MDCRITKGAVGVTPGRPGSYDLDFVWVDLDISMSGSTGSVVTSVLKTHQSRFLCCKPIGIMIIVCYKDTGIMISVYTLES